MRSGAGFVIGFFLGALAGAVAALLMAPESGEELRADIREKGVELQGQATQLAEQTRAQVEEAQERGRIVLAENVKKAQQAVQQAQAKLGTPQEAEPTAEMPA